MMGSPQFLDDGAGAAMMARGIVETAPQDGPGEAGRGPRSVSEAGRDFPRRSHDPFGWLAVKAGGAWTLTVYAGALRAPDGTWTDVAGADFSPASGTVYLYLKIEADGSAALASTTTSSDAQTSEDDRAAGIERWKLYQFTVAAGAVTCARDWIHGYVRRPVSGDADAPGATQKSVEVIGGAAQLYGFDEANPADDGLADLLTADTESGALSKAGAADDYELLVRVGGPSGELKMMPIGTTSGATDPADPCKDHPEGGDGVGIGAEGSTALIGDGGGANGVPAEPTDDGGAAAGACESQCEC